MRGRGRLSWWAQRWIEALEALGRGFDRDPFLLFRRRGRSRERCLAELRARRAARDQPSSGVTAVERPRPEPARDEASPPLEAQIEEFWTLGEDFDSLRFSIR